MITGALGRYVGLGVQDVAEPSAAFDVRFESEGVTGLVRAVDHHDSVGRCDDPVIAPAEPGLDEDVGGQLLHGVPRSSGRSRATGYGIVGPSARSWPHHFPSAGFSRFKEGPKPCPISY